MATPQDVLNIRQGVTIGGGDYPSLHRYPLDPTDKSPHSVVFFVNRRVESEVTRSPQNGNPNFARAVAASQTDLEAQYAQESRLTTDNAGAVLGAGGAVGGAALGTYAAGSFGGASIVGKIAGLAGGLVGGYAAGELVSDSYATERLQNVIQLHIPQPIVAQYVANYNEDDIGAIMGKIGESGLSMDSLLENAGSAGEFVARSAMVAAASVPKALGFDANVGGAVAATSKKVANPYKEQLFTSMAFRKFGFNFEFVPRTQAEYEQVRQIVDLFKVNMHPTRVSDGFFLSYPGEFNIEYRYKDRVNEHVNRISSCALTDMKVTYGGADSFTSIKGTLGIPSEISISLSFTELETLTANRVALDGTRTRPDGSGGTETLVVGGL